MWFWSLNDIKDPKVKVVKSTVVSTWDWTSHHVPSFFNLLLIKLHPACLHVGAHDFCSSSHLPGQLPNKGCEWQKATTWNNASVRNNDKLCNFTSWSDWVSELSHSLIGIIQYKWSYELAHLRHHLVSLLHLVPFSRLTQWLFFACYLRTGRGGAMDTRGIVRRLGFDASAFWVCMLCTAVELWKIACCPSKWGLKVNQNKRHQKVSFVL